MNRGALVRVAVALLLVSQGGASVVAERGSSAQRTTTAGTTTAQTTTDQTAGEFELVSVSSNVPINGTGTLALTFENTGEDVTDASIAVQSPNESVRFGRTQDARRFVGDWSAGERRTVEFRLRAEEFAESRSYPFQAFVSYAGEGGSRERAGPFAFDVTPAETIRLERFEVTAISSNVQAGDTGTITLTLENTGRDVSDAIVTLRSANDQVRLGRSGNASQFVEEWPTGEDVSFEYRATAGNDTAVGSYPFFVSVSYREDGSRTRTPSQVVGVIPAPEQSFSLGDLNSTLRVGDEGSVTGTVTNEGPQIAPNAVLVLASQGENVYPKETEYALGTLERGESVPFEYRIDVSDGATRGPRQLSLVVRYQNQDGDPRRSEPLEARVRVAPQRDEFAVRPSGASVEAGSSSTVSLVVTNRDDRTLRNVDARAFVDSPLTVEDDQAFVPRLEPNESATIRFAVGANGGTLAGTYPMSLDFQYETPDGDEELSDTYEVPIRVAEPEGDGLLPFSTGSGFALPLVVIGVLLGIAGVGAVRRWR
ncbi:COG1361 S-layer family protein [Haladaptatus salinisoli]|uniref:COG1361 S-layer family protein n=1 Tax=Haladaptatus salinisoli TaxID=2884876 RepID=UPI001D0A1BE3|nr:COG1361 S-layer family protein [Haladaptatus salinisoli]